MNLQAIIERNPSVLLSRKKTRSLLSDIFNNDMAKVNVLMTAFDIGFIDSIMNIYPMPEKEKTRLRKIMVIQHSIVDNMATWAIDTWTSCFTAPIVEAIIAAAEAEKETEPVVLPDNAEEESFEFDDSLVVRTDLRTTM